MPFKHTRRALMGELAARPSAAELLPGEETGRTLSSTEPGKNRSQERQQSFVEGAG
jgi:hypothetical protein